MNRSWWVFYGLQLGLTEEATMLMRFGQLRDLVACLSIYRGGAQQAKKKLSFDEVMELE